MANADRVLIGEVVKPHGLRGELCVEWHADSPELCDDLPRVWLEPPSGKAKAFAIAAWRMHHKRLLLTLQGIGDRTQAEAWRGARIFARTEDMPEPEEGEVFLHQLIGLRVLTVDGRQIGLLESVMAEPQEIWTIRGEGGVEILFPAQPEFVEEIDLGAGSVTVAPPPGLLELYLEQAEPSGESPGPATGEDK